MDETSHVTLPSVIEANPVTTPVTTPLPDGWTIQALAALARDIAINLYAEDVILAKHSLNSAQYAEIAKHEVFQRLVEAAAADWNSSKSIQQRLALEAAVTLETTMPTIGARMADVKEPLNAVIEAGKLLAKMSGVGESKTPQAAGEKFTITINLGADTLKYEKTRQIEIQSIPEGESDDLPVQSLPGTQSGE